MSGLGRTTIVNTLCEKKVLAEREYPDPDNAHIVQPMNIKLYPVGKIATNSGFHIFM